MNDRDPIPHTPYDQFTDAEFVTILERAEQTALVKSVIKRLTTKDYVTNYCAECGCELAADLDR